SWFTTTSTAAPISNSGAMSQILLTTDMQVAKITRERWCRAWRHRLRSGGTVDSVMAVDELSGEAGSDIGCDPTGPSAVPGSERGGRIVVVEVTMSALPRASSRI